MNATNRLLDKWWNVARPASAVDAGKRLGVSGQAIANYRSGVSQATPAVLSVMAVQCGEDPALWMALVEAERARSDADRKAWQRLAKRLGNAASIGAVALLVSAPLPAQIEGGTGMHYAHFPLDG